jgi:hypothetical protein
MALVNNGSRSLINPRLLREFTHIVVAERLRGAVARCPRALIGHRPEEFMVRGPAEAVPVREAASTCCCLRLMLTSSAPLGAKLRLSMRGMPPVQPRQPEHNLPSSRVVGR